MRFNFDSVYALRSYWVFPFEEPVVLIREENYDYLLLKKYNSISLNYKDVLFYGNFLEKYLGRVVTIEGTQYLVSSIDIGVTDQLSFVPI